VKSGNFVKRNWFENQPLKSSPTPLSLKGGRGDFLDWAWPEERIILLVAALQRCVLSVEKSGEKRLDNHLGMGYKNLNKGYFEMKELFSGKTQLILAVLLGLLGLLILPTSPTA
jgi:hypothetical protein